MKQADIDRIWYGGGPVPWWLRALVPVYRLLRGLSRIPYRLGWRKPVRLPVPVVVIGNLTAGGTGKTPLVLALIDAARAHGWHPGVVSRGHGGSATVPMLLDAEPDPAVVGDEPCLIRIRSSAPVAIGRDRVAAASLLVDVAVDLILADDGLQNSSLARGLEICVIDGERRFGNGRLLPAGPLRESVVGLGRMDFVVCNGGSAGSGEIAMTLRVQTAHPVCIESQPRPLSSFSGQAVHAVAGIGNPRRFFAALRHAGMVVVEHEFDDHHAFRAGDLEFGDDLPVLMTEKDAVKCRGFANARLWQVPAIAEVPESFLEAVFARISSLASGKPGSSC